MLKPKHLSRGDTVAIVSLSSGSLGEPELLHKYRIAKERLERDYGLRVVAMPHALRGRKFVYEHPEARARDLMDAFRDPEIRAVFNAIGGDDTIRLLPYVDFGVLRDNPKIFTGFSDTTGNHFMLHSAGLVSYYGLSVMCELAEYAAINEYTKAAMENMLFFPKETLDVPCSPFYCDENEKVFWKEENMHIPRQRHPNTGYEVLQGHGTAAGELLGGCLDVFPMLVGTSVWPSPDAWRGKLLLLETSEVDMEPDYVVWYLRNLLAQGILHAVNGIVVGRPARLGKYAPFG